MEKCALILVNLNRKIKTHMVTCHDPEDILWLGVLLDLSSEVKFFLF